MERSQYIDAILPTLGAIVGFALAFILISRLMREKRRPSNTIAWLLIIVLVPYVGVPLYLLLGGRKIGKLAKNKRSLNLSPDQDAEGIIADSPYGVVTAGNRARFLPTGIAAFKTLEEEIQNATERIDITTFILKHDAIGRRIVKELSRKASQGVQVRLLLDALGSFGKKTLYMLELEKAGGRIERFMPMFPIASWGRANLRNHRKIAIFDDQRAIIGGRNIGRDYMGPVPAAKRWKDFGALIEGPAVTQLAEIFEADWAFACSKKQYAKREIPYAKKVDTDRPSSIEIMASGPDTHGDPLYEKVLSVIHEAAREIVIATPYFLPDEVLLRSLMVKARTGKKVTIIVPKRSNHPITDLARNHYLRELIDAGAEILLYRPVMMHGKVLLVDRKIAMTGSANIDLRSLFVNYEVGAFFYSEHDIEEIDSWLEGIAKDCDPMEEVYPKPPHLAREIAEDICRLLTPLL